MPAVVVPSLRTPRRLGQLGNRSFTAPLGISPLPSSPPAFPSGVVADINGDGKDDLVLGELGPAVFLSAGRQGFELDQDLMIYGYGETPTSVTVADFNGDGLLDIAVGIAGGDDVVLFTNDGTGKYELTSYAMGARSIYSITSDFNHDGHPDMAFLNFLSIAEPPIVTVLMHQPTNSAVRPDLHFRCRPQCRFLAGLSPAICNQVVAMLIDGFWLH
jgi:FG-GAP-like repeat